MAQWTRFTPLRARFNRLKNTTLPVPADNTQRIVGMATDGIHRLKMKVAVISPEMEGRPTDKFSIQIQHTPPMNLGRRGSRDTESASAKLDRTCIGHASLATSKVSFRAVDLLTRIYNTTNLSVKTEKYNWRQTRMKRLNFILPLDFTQVPHFTSEKKWVSKKRGVIFCFFCAVRSPQFLPAEHVFFKSFCRFHLIFSVFVCL